MTNARIAVVGSINLDLVLQVDRIALEGETLLAHSYAEVPGGKGANQAVAAARMGAQVSLIGCTGDDGFGRSLRAGLQADDISITHLRTSQHAPTGMASIQVDAQGRNSIVVAGGANQDVSPTHIDAAWESVRQAAFVLCQLEVPLTAIAHLCQRASADGVAVVLNPSPIQPLPADLLASLTGLILNEHEASRLSGLPITSVPTALHAAQQLQQRGPHWVALTLGALGACLADGAHAPCHLPAQSVTAVDNTGAGDTFAGALLAWMAQGLPLREAAELAQAAAALCVTRRGAQPSIPYRAELGK